MQDSNFKGREAKAAATATPVLLPWSCPVLLGLFSRGGGERYTEVGGVSQCCQGLTRIPARRKGGRGSGKKAGRGRLTITRVLTTRSGAYLCFRHFLKAFTSVSLRDGAFQG